MFVKGSYQNQIIGSDSVRQTNFLGFLNFGIEFPIPADLTEVKQTWQSIVYQI